MMTLGVPGSFEWISETSVLEGFQYLMLALRERGMA
jgi:hypothetical protein